MKIGYPKGDNYKLVLASLQPCQRRFIEVLTTCEEEDLLIHLQAFTQWVWEKSDIICWASVLNRFDEIFRHYAEITSNYIKGEKEIDPAKYYKEVELVKNALKTSIMILENCTSKSNYNSLDLLIQLLDDVNLEVVYLTTRLLCVFFSSRNRKNSVLKEIPLISVRLSTLVSNPLPDRYLKIMSTNETKYSRVFDQGAKTGTYVSCPLILQYYLKSYQYWLSKDTNIELDLYNKHQENPDRVLKIPIQEVLNMETISQTQKNTQAVNYSSNERFMNSINQFLETTTENQVYLHMIKTFKLLVKKYQIEENHFHILRYQMVKAFSLYFVQLQRLLVNTRLSSLICMLLINSSTYTQFLNYNPCFLHELSWFIKCHDQLDYSTMIITTELLSAMIYDGIQYKTLSSLLGFTVPHGIFVKVLKSYLRHENESTPLPPLLRLKEEPAEGADRMEEDYTSKDEKDLIELQMSGFCCRESEDHNFSKMLVDGEDRMGQIVQDEERMRVLLQLLIVYYSIISYHGNCSSLTNVNVLESLVRFIRCRNPIYTPVVIYVVQVVEALLDYNQTVSRVLRTELQLYHVFLSRLQYDMSLIENSPHFGEDESFQKEWPKGWLIPKGNRELELREYWLAFSESSARKFLFKTVIKDIYSVTRPYSGRAEINDYDVFAPTSPMIPVILKILANPMNYGHGVYMSVVTLILDTIGDDPVSQEEMHQLEIIPSFLNSISEETLKSEESLNVVPTAICDMFLHRTGQDYYKSMKYSFVLKLIDIVVKREFVLFDRFGEVAASIGISLDTIVRHHETSHAMIVKRIIKVIYDLLNEALKYPEFRPVLTERTQKETEDSLQHLKQNSEIITLDTLSLLDELKPEDFYADRIANLGKCLSTFLSYTQTVSYFISLDGIKLLMQLCTVPCLPPMFMQVYSQHPLVLIIKYLTAQATMPSLIHFHTITQHYLKPRGLTFEKESSTRNQKQEEWKKLHGTLHFLTMMHKDNTSLYYKGCCGTHQPGVELKLLPTCDLHQTITMCLEMLSSELARLFEHYAVLCSSESNFQLINNYLSHEHPELRAYKEYTNEKKNGQTDVVFSANDFFWSSQCKYAYSNLNREVNSEGEGLNIRTKEKLTQGEQEELLMMEINKLTLGMAKTMIYTVNLSANKGISYTCGQNECLKTHILKHTKQIVELCIGLLKKTEIMNESEKEANYKEKYFRNIKFTSEVLEFTYKLIIDEKTNGMYLLTTFLFSTKEGMEILTKCFDYFFNVFFGIIFTMVKKLNPELNFESVFGLKVDLKSFPAIEESILGLRGSKIQDLKSMYNIVVKSLQICLSFFSKCTNPRTALNTIDTDVASFKSYVLNMTGTEEEMSDDDKDDSYMSKYSKYSTRKKEKPNIGNLFGKMITEVMNKCWKWFGFMVNIDPMAPASSTASPFFYIPNKLMTFLLKVHLHVLDYISPSRQQSLNLHFNRLINNNSIGVRASTEIASQANANNRRIRRRTRMNSDGEIEETEEREEHTTSIDTVRTYLQEMGFTERDINNAITQCGSSDITTLTEYLINAGDVPIQNLNHSHFSMTPEDENVNKVVQHHLKNSYLFHLSNPENDTEIGQEECEESEGSSMEAEGCEEGENGGGEEEGEELDKELKIIMEAEEKDYRKIMEGMMPSLKSQTLKYILELCKLMPTFLPTGYESISKLHSFKIKFMIPSEPRWKVTTDNKAGVLEKTKEPYTGKEVFKNFQEYEIEFNIQNMMYHIIKEISEIQKDMENREVNVKNENPISLFSPLIFIEDNEKQLALDQLLDKFPEESQYVQFCDGQTLDSQFRSNQHWVKSEPYQQSGSQYRQDESQLSDQYKEENKNQYSESEKERQLKEHRVKEEEEVEMDYNNELAKEHQRLTSLFYLLSHLMAGKDNFTNMAMKFRDENRDHTMLHTVTKLVEHYIGLRSTCIAKGVLNMGIMGIRKRPGFPVPVADWCLAGEWETWYHKRTTTNKFDYKTIKYGLYATGCTPQIALPPPFFKYALICLEEVIKMSILEGIMPHIPKSQQMSPKNKDTNNSTNSISKDKENKTLFKAEREKLLERLKESQSPNRLEDREGGNRGPMDAFKHFREYEMSEEMQEKLLYGCMKIFELFPGLDMDVACSGMSIISTLTEVYRNAEKLLKYKAQSPKSNMDFMRVLLSMPRSARCAGGLRMMSNIMIHVIEDTKLVKTVLKNKIINILKYGPVSVNKFFEEIQPFDRKSPETLFELVEEMCTIVVDESAYPDSEEDDEVDRIIKTSPLRSATLLRNPRSKGALTIKAMNRRTRTPTPPSRYEIKDMSICLNNSELLVDRVKKEKRDYEAVEVKEIRIDERKAYQVLRMAVEYLHVTCNVHGITNMAKNEKRTHYPLCYDLSSVFYLVNALSHNFPLPLMYPDLVSNITGVPGDLSIRGFPHKLEKLDKYNVRSLLLFITRTMFNMICCLVSPKNLLHNLVNNKTEGNNAEMEEAQKLVIDTLENYSNTLMMFASENAETSAVIVEEVTEILKNVANTNVKESGPFLIPVAVYTICNLLHNLLQFKFKNMVNVSEVLGNLKKTLCVILTKLDLFKPETKIVCGSITRVLVLLTTTTNTTYPPTASEQKEEEETAVVVELEDTLTEESESDNMEIDAQEEEAELDYSEDEGEEEEFSEDGDQEGEDDMIIDVTSTESNESSESENAMEEEEDDDEEEGNEEMALPHEVEEDYHSNQYSDSVTTSSMEDGEEEEEDEGPRIRVAGEIEEEEPTEINQIIDTTTNISIPEENESDYSRTNSEPEEINEDVSDSIGSINNENYANTRQAGRANDQNHTIHIEIQFANNQNNGRTTNNNTSNTRYNNNSGVSWRTVNLTDNTFTPTYEPRNSSANRTISQPLTWDIRTTRTTRNANSRNQDSAQSEAKTKAETWSNLGDLEQITKNPLLPQSKKTNLNEGIDPVKQIFSKRFEIVKVKLKEDLDRIEKEKEAKNDHEETDKIIQSILPQVRIVRANRGMNAMNQSSESDDEIINNTNVNNNNDTNDNDNNNGNGRSRSSGIGGLFRTRFNTRAARDTRPRSESIEEMVRNIAIDDNITSEAIDNLVRNMAIDTITSTNGRMPNLVRNIPIDSMRNAEASSDENNDSSETRRFRARRSPLDRNRMIQTNASRRTMQTLDETLDMDIDFDPLNNITIETDQERIERDLSRDIEQMESGMDNTLENVPEPAQPPRMEIDSEGRYYNRGLEIIANALGITYDDLFRLAQMDPGVIAELPQEMREEIISQQLHTINVEEVAMLRQSRPQVTRNSITTLPSRSDLQYLESLPRSLRLDVTRSIYGENSAQANEINATIDLEGDNTSLVAALGPFYRGEGINSFNNFLGNLVTGLETSERGVNVNVEGIIPQLMAEEEISRGRRGVAGSIPSSPPNVSQQRRNNENRESMQLSGQNEQRAGLTLNEQRNVQSRDLRYDPNDARNGVTLGFIIGEIRNQTMGRRINQRSRNNINRRLTNNISRRNDAFRDIFLLPGRGMRMSRGEGNQITIPAGDNQEQDERSTIMDSRIFRSIPQILNTFDTGLAELFPQRTQTQEQLELGEMSCDRIMEEIVKLLPKSPVSPSLLSKLELPKKEKEEEEKGQPKEKEGEGEEGEGEQKQQPSESNSYNLLSNGCKGEIEAGGLLGICKMFFMPNEINKRVLFKLLYNVSLGPTQQDLIKMFLYMLKESILNVDMAYECPEIEENFFKNSQNMFLQFKSQRNQSINISANLPNFRKSKYPVMTKAPKQGESERAQQQNAIGQVFEENVKVDYESLSYMCSERILEQLRSLLIALPCTVSSFSKPLSYTDEPTTQELKRKKKRTEASQNMYPINFFLCATATNLFQSSTKHMNHLLMVIHNLLVYKPEGNMNELDSEIVGNIVNTCKVDEIVHSQIINSVSMEALEVFLRIYTSHKCQSTWLQLCNSKDANAQTHLEVISQFLGVLYRNKYGEFITSFMTEKFKNLKSLITRGLETMPNQETKLEYQIDTLILTLLRMTQLMSETVKQSFTNLNNQDKEKFNENKTSETLEKEKEESVDREYLEVLNEFFKGLELEQMWEMLDSSLTSLTERSLVRNFVGDFYKESHINNTFYFEQVRSLIPLIEVFLTTSQLLVAKEYRLTDMQFDRILSNINYESSLAVSSERTEGINTETQYSVSYIRPMSGSGSREGGMLTSEGSRSMRDDEDEEVVDISPTHLSLLNFVEKHKRLLNLFIKQSPSLLNNAFLPLIKLAPMCVSFDIKRQYFRQKLREGRIGLRIEPIKINVRRQHVFLDSYHQLRLKTGDEMKGKLSVSFGGEEGVDAGGLTREWYTILSKEIFNPNYALFTREGRKQEFNHPNPLSAINPDHLNYFKFIGRVIGKALYDGHHMEAYFCRSFYKHMLGRRITPQDAESVDPQFYNNLISIKSSSLEELGLELYFSTEIDEFGKVKVIDLIPNGRNILVTDENKNKYIKLLCRHKVTNGIREQLDAFMEGFRQLISPELISVFDDRELELLISGIPIIDLENMKQNVEYVNYTESSSQIKWLWEILGEFDQNHLAAFLQFVTGTSRVPIGGFKNLMGMRGPQRISIHRTFGQDRLPTAHTCFNQLDLPLYDTKEMLKSKLLQAILEGKEGFGFI